MSRLFWYPGHEVLLPRLVRAEGSSVWDADGRRYVDLESGVWCAGIGHCHPRVLRALSEQAGALAHTGYCYSHPVVEEAAEEVLAALGLEDGRCTFLCSGSEAVEYGVRVARETAGRPLMLTMADSYFGAYGAASVRDPETWATFDWTRCAGAAGREGCAQGCPHWCEIPFERVGCFLLEPGSSSGLVRFPPSGLVDAIVREVRRLGGLVMVNEVTTGLGRTGEWFGFQHYGLRPDLVALGKGIGNGYPVSVTACSEAVADRLGGSTPRWSQSHQNDPLGAAVAREVVRVIRDEGLVERGREAGRWLRDGLEGIARRTGRIAEVRARGPMLAVELDDDPPAARTTRVFRGLLDRGFIVARRPGLNVLRLDPPLTIARADVDAFLAALEDEVLRAAE